MIVQDPLIEHITRITGTKPEDPEAILRFFSNVHVEKKQNLQEADHLCLSLFFVVKGCLRLYFLNEKGIQHTVQFAIENWWLTDLAAFHGQKQTPFYIQAVERSEIISISLPSYNALLEKFPQLEKYFRIIYQIGYGASQLRMKYNHDLSREGLFNQFSKQFPEFIQRIPQYLLASYLDITPEYLSELRKKRS